MPKNKSELERSTIGKTHEYELSRSEHRNSATPYHYHPFPTMNPVAEERARTAATLLGLRGVGELRPEEIDENPLQYDEEVRHNNDPDSDFSFDPNLQTSGALDEETTTHDNITFTFSSDLIPKQLPETGPLVTDYADDFQQCILENIMAIRKRMELMEKS